MFENSRQNAGKNVFHDGAIQFHLSLQFHQHESGTISTRNARPEATALEYRDPIHNI